MSIAFETVAVPMAVAELSARSLGSDEDREAWLEARRGVITATEAKLLAQAHVDGNPTTVRRVIADLVKEKLEGSTFTGNHFTVWGKMREPVILAELGRRYGISGCGLLVHAEGSSRHAATPDGAGVDFDGLLVLAEIKTSKNDVTVGSSGYLRAGYFFQMQWQMYCTGARRVLYVVERHDNDWLGWDLRDPSTWRLETGPRVAPLVCQWVDRDDAVIESMVRLADEALAVIDAEREARAELAAARGDVPAPSAEESEFAEVLRDATLRVLTARERETAAASDKKSAWDRLLALGAERGDFAEKYLEGSVRYVAAGESEVDAPDEEAARAAHAKEWAQLERARKRVADLEAAWADLARPFTKKETRVGKPSLTVTAARGKKKGAEE